MSEGPLFFGVRHLSPAGAFHLRRLLDEVRPQLVLVEAPADLEPLLPDIVRSGTQPPIAMLAYTREPPVRSLLYPLAEYSPEYQAMLWAREHNVPCRFMDLPSDIFLALSACDVVEEEEADAEDDAEEAKDGVEEPAGEEETPDETGPDGESGAGASGTTGDGADGKDEREAHELFWERVLEHAADGEDYRQGAAAYGKELRLREETENRDARRDLAEGRIREAYMCRVMAQAVAAGVPARRMVVVTGAYHLEGLRSVPPMTDAELAALPRRPAACTLMPYTSYRLSSRSGYGAGTKAPAYSSLIWQGLHRQEPRWHARAYLARIARFLRQEGHPVSTADVIEAVRLADALARLRGFDVPALPDLRDAAITCLGGGSLARISRAVADAEIGTQVGSLPERVSRTSLQDDFDRCLRALKLERFRTPAPQELSLDLRENRRVKSAASAFLGLRRSFFLHRLRVLGISFATLRDGSSGRAEGWSLCWTPETEIELVERSLTGNSIQEAVAAQFRQTLAEAGSPAAVAAVIEDAFACGMVAELHRAAAALQALSTEATDFADLAGTAARLSFVLRFGDVRRMDTRPLEPLLQQIFLRCCLLLSAACDCDDKSAEPVLSAMDSLDGVARAHAFLDEAFWLRMLEDEAERDEGNACLSGLAAAILLERGKMPDDRLQCLARRHLSPGMPVDSGAGWFAGLARKNRHALIGRLPLWEDLSRYIDSLDDETFKRALLVLRRALADFSAGEKNSIAENLAEIWGLDGAQVSEVLNAALSGEAEEMLQDIESFNFDDL